MNSDDGLLALMSEWGDKVAYSSLDEIEVRIAKRGSLLTRTAHYFVASMAKEIVAANPDVLTFTYDYPTTLDQWKRVFAVGEWLEAEGADFVIETVERAGNTRLFISITF